METKISEEINQFLRKNEPQELVLLGFYIWVLGAPIDIFVNGYI